eukprot:CAMPEP_0201661984 /NCGR_PEP_ID=MMETSP0494-20130426/4208_1 /ASSEMBLY_ACC=CAM_ASM_000839 /TAXON_ID=420259 /ORGANISM="Thalassiosira gravida, Strain GMp14c1" /LENGTH=1144 /DNA_ID=CAMNT_0048140245 /DNA_START=29 /DNA_END=3463 /DNA_ORIENTATION=+
MVETTIAPHNEASVARLTNEAATEEGKKEEEATPSSSAPIVKNETHTSAPVAIATVNNDSGNIINTIARPNSNPKNPPLQKPSYYIDSFHEHFFPHPQNDAVDTSNKYKKPLSIPQRYATSMARRPWTHLITAFVIAVILSFVGLRFGDFKVAINNSGWWSRGTEIANRATQEMMIRLNRYDLFFDETGEVWEELQSEMQPDWQGPRNDRVGENQNNETEGMGVDDATLTSVCSGEWYGSGDMMSGSNENLFTIWKTEDAEAKDPEKSILDADAMYDLCMAEENTLSALEDGDHCYKCPDTGSCVPPYSLVLMARLHLTGNDISKLDSLSELISCDTLKSTWTAGVQGDFTMALKTCVNWSIRMASDDTKNKDGMITMQNTSIAVTNPCPFPIRFRATVVDNLFPTTLPNIVRYSSSYYATKMSKEDTNGMYEANENDNAYDRSDGTPLSGVYETTDETFQMIYSDAIVGRDMVLAVGSAGVTIIAMVIHTQSPFLTLMGLFQILLSFPLAYFVYYFIAGLVFFPFLNFIGIFVVFALGADDVFVAVDKWKNARHELPYGTTEQVAALALPDAAYSMLLTSMTTAVAFFGTAICPVGPIVCFAVFCGLLITFDYMMNIFLVFPALCLYDKWLLAGSKNCCVNFDWCCGRKVEDEDVFASNTDLALQATATNTDHASSNEEGAHKHMAERNEEERQGLLEDEHKTLIHRFLDGYYIILHKFRWLILAAATAATIGCTVFAAQLTQPANSDVALLPDSNEYQMHWAWKQNLLSNELAKLEGSEAILLWGVEPADTGTHLDPDTWTTLVLDDEFDPKSKEAQSYLLDFCDRLFESFGRVKEDYECPMVQFDGWLKDQSTSDTPTMAYTANCKGASSAPVPSDVFDPCIIAWSKDVNNMSILQVDGSVKVIEVRTKSNVSYDASQKLLKEEWTTYEDWLENERQDSAPSGVDKFYHSDLAYWWFDTNNQMMKTAYGAAGIALFCAAVVVYISTRSFVLTTFAAIAILYVLVAATACLVGLGWTLGFLESVLFAILIGISCDFVIHVGHAYTMYSGDVNRGRRSHFALTHMGPSILAAAFTTFMAAVVMIFTEITFFRKFAVILFMTILHSTIGCFVVFLVLCDCFGPAEPTKAYDAMKAKICGSSKKE